MRSRAVAKKVCVVRMRSRAVTKKSLCSKNEVASSSEKSLCSKNEVSRGCNHHNHGNNHATKSRHGAILIFPGVVVGVAKANENDWKSLN